MRFLLILAGGLTVAATPARAEVVASSATMFDLKQELTVDAPVQQTWDALKAPQRWWNAEHTYSGKAENLYLDAQASGCFCERLDNKGSIEHLRIAYIQPPRMIRFTGSLGPLQAEAVAGTLTIRLDPAGANATKVTLTYLVAGHIRAGADTLAPKVDEVLAQQLLGLKSAAEAAPAAEPAK